MPIGINGSGTITGISAGGLPDGTITPAELSTGAPSWNGSGVLSFNSGYGSAATAYGCRAWVNFNGTGTVSIRNSGNVSSITDVSVGLYVVNFSNTMPDGNYTIVALGSSDGSSSVTVGVESNSANVTASGAQIRPWDTSGNPTDRSVICVAVFR